MVLSVICFLVMKLGLLGVSVALVLRTIQLKYQGNSVHRRELSTLLTIALIGFESRHILWVLKLLFKLSGGGLDSLVAKLLLLCIRLSWIVNMASYLAFARFLERLVKLDDKISWVRLIVWSLGLCCAGAIVYLACAYFHVTHCPLGSLNALLYGFHNGWDSLCLLMTILGIMYDLRQKQRPLLVQQQVVTLITHFIIPHAVFNVFLSQTLIRGRILAAYFDVYIVLIVGDMLLYAMLYFCIRRILRLRFLNISDTVRSPQRYGFVRDFQAVLNQLGKVIKPEELSYITSQFFTRAFSIPDQFVELHIKSASSRGILDTPVPVKDAILFGDTPQERELQDRIAQEKILVRDEIAFDHFYDQEQHQAMLLGFLDSLRADIFLPLYERQLYERQIMVGYLVVRQNVRPGRLYGNEEQDEMGVFAEYLGAIVSLLQSRDLVTLVRHEKELKDELFKKQQEINHFKEGVRNLIKQQDHPVGVAIVKSCTISLVNSEAQCMMEREGVSKLAPGSAKRTPQGRQLFQLARDARTYQTERTTVIATSEGFATSGSELDRSELLWECTAYPIVDTASVVVLMKRSNPMGRFMFPVNTAKATSRWEYSLYLETTRSGRLVSQLVPGASELLTNFKIDLLGVALGKQVVLLELPEEDVLSVVRLLHAISLRERLVTCEITRNEEGSEYAEAIFGRELLVGEERRCGLLETASEMGTLHIMHIERLSLASQGYLATFLTSGIYQSVGSRRLRSSAARVICSTSMQVRELVAQRRFSVELWEALRDHEISLPSLTALPAGDLRELIRGMAHIPVEVNAIASLVQVSDRDVRDIIASAPASIAELKYRVVQRVAKKASKHNVHHLVHLDDGSLDELPPHIREAVRLGKHALKDKKYLLALWDMFKNQARIAAILKVNRSSVSRRLRELQIEK